MQRFALSLIIISIFSFSSFAQNTLIVDNNPNAPQGDHIFSTLEEAILATQGGEVIQLVPSVSGYDWPINSDLWDTGNYVLKGAGLNTDLENSLQRGRSVINDEVVIGYTNIPENIIFDGVVLANGIRFNNADNFTIINSEINRLIVFSNAYPSAQHGPTTNVILRNNILNLYNVGILTDGTVNAFLYENNVIYIGEAADAEINFSTLNHNLIFGFNTNSSLTGIENIFNNNIIEGFTDTDGMTRSVFNYNLYEWTLGQNDGASGEFNIVTDFDLPTLLDDERIIQNTWDRQWEVTSSSDDIVGKASNGGNIGPTGSNAGAPFKKIAFSLPVITDLIAPTTFKAGTNPEITIKAKGN